MHLLKMSLFSDVVATCGAHGVCFCRNDALRDINATVVLEEWDLVAGTSTDAVKVDVMLRGGQAHTG